MVVDCPAGNGVTTKILRDIGSKPVAYDLFPEYFNLEGVECERANVLDKLPMVDKCADVVICQEGIEHFSDQIKPLKEFNRILKEKGRLLITTPNYSNIRSKLSYLFAESERYSTLMPPNEIDSIWMSKQEIISEIYYGHIFLVGAQKLRVMGKIAGFRIRKVIFTRAKTTSIILLPFFYPLVLFFNYLAYFKSLRKRSKEGVDAKEVYKEQLKLNLSAKLLVASHIVIEFEKEADHEEVASNLAGKYVDASKTIT